MKIMLRGVRGSIPTTSPEMSYYGGNTSCTAVKEGDSILVLDGGSGMQQFKLLDGTGIKRVDILLTHLHLDHIQGLGFFNPFFNPQNDIHIWGPASKINSLHARLSRYLSPPLFPVLLRDLPCKLTLHEIENSSFEVGPFKIESRFVIHPGPTVGFRVSNGRSVFTYIPDHEPVLGANELLKDTKWLSGFDLAENADLLLHDAQYSIAEYPFRIGWGHSNMDDAVKFASMAGVKHLLLAHHDPGHTDIQLNELFADLQKSLSAGAGNNYSFKYELAVEGMEIELP
ncbi:MAG: MBL fold metallo-hydrolase [Bacteroidetes bacterium]|nr:MAG: MBL fold metallo-hydrolase [Bacteroidota bacterium]